MPWIPSYSRHQAADAIAGSFCWADVLRKLDLKVHGRNLATLRKWAARWEIRTWVRFYERERAVEEGRDPSVVEIPKRTWPNRRDKRKAA